MVVNTLCHMLGEDWKKLCQEEPLREIVKLPKESWKKAAKKLLKSEANSSKKTEFVNEKINEVDL